jgi:hypothetical protein
MIAAQPGSPQEHRPRWRRSVIALGAGAVVVVALSVGADAALQALGVYPASGEPMSDAGLYVLALAYRSLFAIVGSYVAARLAGYAPMRHALGLGVIGLALALVGAVAAAAMGLGPAWYPWGLVATALPCAWAGGLLHARMHPSR